MARYIDADKIHKLVDEKVAEGKDGWAKGVPYEWAYALTVIDMQPTADVAPRAEVANVKAWIFENSPFEMLDIAFKRLFPKVKYTAFFEPNIRDGEHGEKVCGLTDFDDEGNITIFVDTDLSINDATEIFAHELAHAGVGVEHGHDEVWEKAFDDLFNEYNRIGEEMFGSNIDATKGDSYSNALSEIDKIKCNFARKIFEEIEREITAALKSNYKVLPQLEESEAMWNNVNGKINALRGIEYFIEELKKKYENKSKNISQNR